MEEKENINILKDAILNRIKLLSYVESTESTGIQRSIEEYSNLTRINELWNIIDMIKEI